jgi:hypothetical protein
MKQCSCSKTTNKQMRQQHMKQCLCSTNAQNRGIKQQMKTKHVPSKNERERDIDIN